MRPGAPAAIMVILGTLLVLPACAPYSGEDVSIPSDGKVVLAGTLSIPDGEGPFPAVVFLSGSGPQTRDGKAWGFPLFRVLADHLARRSIAVLRCDDRGCGSSSGDGGGNAVTTRDFAADALAQVRYLRSRPEIDPARIGLLGISEGALAAGMAASFDDGLEFVILLAGPAVPVREVLHAQRAFNLRQIGFDDETVERTEELYRRIYDAIGSDEDLSGLREELRQEYLRRIRSLPPEEREKIEDPEALAERKMQREFTSSGSRWGMYLLAYDPGPDQAAMAGRVLALYGGKDRQVPADQNAPALEATFQEAGKENYRIRILPDANHLFQVAVTGSPREYEELDREFVPGFVEAVAGWILAGDPPE